MHIRSVTEKIRSIITTATPNKDDKLRHIRAVLIVTLPIRPYHRLHVT